MSQQINNQPLIFTLQDVGENNFHKTFEFINNQLTKLLSEGECKDKLKISCNKNCTACTSCPSNLYANKLYYYPIVINRLYYSLLLILKNKYEVKFKNVIKKDKTFKQKLTTYCKENQEELTEAQFLEVLVKSNIHHTIYFLNTATKFLTNPNDKKKVELLGNNMVALRTLRNNYDYESTVIVSDADFETAKIQAKKIKKILCSL